MIEKIISTFNYKLWTSLGLIKCACGVSAFARIISCNEIIELQVINI